MTREPPEIPNVHVLNKGPRPMPKGAPGYTGPSGAPDTNAGLTPYGYLMSIMRDTDADPYLRVMAAEALMPYCHKQE